MDMWASTKTFRIIRLLDAVATQLPLGEVQSGSRDSRIRCQAQSGPQLRESTNDNAPPIEPITCKKKAKKSPLVKAG
jgi:hypothetical protein